MFYGIKSKRLYPYVFVYIMYIYDSYNTSFIISQLCKTNYFAISAILVLYLTRKLIYDDDTATIIFHMFNTVAYFMCIFGAILSDSWLGKFKTILYLSAVYAVGSIIVALGAIPTLYLPGR